MNLFFSKLTLPAVLLAILLATGCQNDPKNTENAPPAGNPELMRLSKLIESDPQNDSLLFLRAQIYYELEGYDEAIVDLGKAMLLDSMQPAYYHLLSDVFLDYSKSYYAVRTMEAAVQKFPKRIATLLKMSELYLIVKRHSDALRPLEKIFEQDPLNSEAYFMTGRVALDMGDQNRAIAAFRKAVQIDASLVDAWLFLGKIFSDKNDPLAIQYFDNALRLDSTQLDAQLEKAFFFKKQGKFDKAFEIYEHIILQDPDASEAYFDMGTIYLEQDSFAKAYKNFDLAIKTDPLFVKAYYYRGVASEELKNMEAAVADYRQAVKMSPNFQEARDALQRLQIK